MATSTLYRTRSNKMNGGVAGGLADYLNMFVSLVRIVTALVVLFTGVGPILYLLAWFILPEEGSTRTGFDAVREEADKFKAHKGDQGKDGGYDTYR